MIAVRLPEGRVNIPLSAVDVADAVAVPEMVELVLEMMEVENVEVGMLLGAEVDFGGRISIEGILEAEPVSSALATVMGRSVVMNVGGLRTLETLVCGGGAGAMLLFGLCLFIECLSYLLIFVLLFLRWLENYMCK